MNNNSIENSKENDKDKENRLKNLADILNKNSIETSSQSAEKDKIKEESKKKSVDISAIDNKYLIKYPYLGGNYPNSSIKYVHRSSDKVAFKDKGKKIEVQQRPLQAVVKDAILLAESKGWEEIKVKGNKEFRQAAWIEAKSVGLEVKGYTPNEQDQRILNRRIEKEKNQESKPTNKSWSSDQEKRENIVNNFFARYAEDITSIKEDQEKIIKELKTRTDDRDDKLKLKDQHIKYSGHLVSHGVVEKENEPNTYFVKLKGKDGKVRELRSDQLKDVMDNNKMNKGDDLTLEKKSKENEIRHQWEITSYTKAQPKSEKPKEVEYER